MEDLHVTLNHLRLLCKLLTGKIQPDTTVQIPHTPKSQRLEITVPVNNFPHGFNPNPTAQEDINQRYLGDYTKIRNFCRENDIIFFETPAQMWKVQFTESIQPQLQITVDRCLFILNREKYCNMIIEIQTPLGGTGYPIQIHTSCSDEEDLRLTLQYIHGVVIDWEIGIVNAHGIRTAGADKDKIIKMCIQRDWYMEDDNCVVYIYPFSTTTTDRSDLDERLRVRVFPYFGNIPSKYFYSFSSNQTDIKRITGDPHILRTAMRAEKIQEDITNIIQPYIDLT